MESRGSTARAVRIGSMLLIALVAFAAGLAVRGWGGDGAADAVEPRLPAVVDQPPIAAPIRLVRADPGALHRPAPRPSPAAAAPQALASAQEAPPPAAPPSPAAPPAPQPSPRPPAERTDPAPTDERVGTFDTEE